MPTTPVPFPNADLNLTAVTPFRKTRVVFGLPEYRKVREGTEIHTRGEAMAKRSGQPAGKNLNVRLLPSKSWCIASWEMQGKFESTLSNGNLIPMPDGTGLPPGVETALATGFKSFVSAGTIPGVTYSGALNPSPFARKRKDAASDWHAELTADASSFVAPQLPQQFVPMRRVANSTPNYGPNQPLYLRFLGPGSPLATTDAFLTWYFGGDVTTGWKDPAITVSGGQFCMIFYGGGHVQLLERTALNGTVIDPLLPWRLVDEWQWEVPGKVANQQHVILVTPEGLDTLNFTGPGWEHLFESDSAKCGYTHKDAVTGVGTNMRLDMREDLRLPFQFGRQSFPSGGSTGTPNDAVMFGVPFNILQRMAAGTNIHPYLDQVNTPGGAARSVVPIVFDGKTKTQLPGPDGSGNFQTLVGSQRNYYCRYAFQSPDNKYTPFLRGATFKVDGSLQLFTPTPFYGGEIMEVAINGPDLESDCDHANVLIEDTYSTLAVGASGLGGLDRHADIHCQIQTAWDPADKDLADSAKKWWVLFDGTLVNAPGARAGRDFGGGATQYPAVDWKTYRIQLAGPWYRLNHDWNVIWQSGVYAEDPNAAFDTALNRRPPWQVIDIIKDLLKKSGFDDSQMKIVNPDGGTTGGPRLFASGKDTQNWFIRAGSQVTEILQSLLNDYLGAKLIWDKEALPHGRWLTVYPPPLTGTYTSLYRFHTTQPPDAPEMAVHLPGAWPAGTTFVTQYTRRIEPPEANFFIVAAAPNPGIISSDPQMPAHADLRAIKELPSLSMAVGINWRSTDFAGYPAADPASIDWIPYGVKPYVLIDPHLAIDGDVEKTNEACRYVCRRVMNASAYGLRWFEWLAPLVAYMDPDPVYNSGPRTFRTYDVVEFNEDGTIYPIVLTSVNPQIGLPEGDLAQWAHYEGYVPPTPLSY